MKRRALALTGLLVGAGQLAEVRGEGKLEAFKTEATVPSGSACRSDDHPPGRSCLADGAVDPFAEVVWYVFAEGGLISWQRVTSAEAVEAAPEAPPRAVGEPLIPYVRADVAYESVESDVEAVDVRAEVGFGPFGLECNPTRYREASPADTLDLLRVHGLYRMSFGSHVETDVGLGALTIDGEGDSTRFSLTMPVLIYPWNGLGLELRPAWSGDVSDYDVGLYFGWRYIWLKAGYRWVFSGEQSLNGAYAGVSLRF